MPDAAKYGAMSNKVTDFAWVDFHDAGTGPDVDNVIDADLRNDYAVHALRPDKAEFRVLMDLQRYGARDKGKVFSRHVNLTLSSKGRGERACGESGDESKG